MRYGELPLGNLAAVSATIETTDDAASSGKKRLRPHQLVIILGIGIGVFTAASGVAGAVLQWHSDDEVSREVFGGIPGVLQLMFYVVVSSMLVYGAVLFSQRTRNWERGRPDNRATSAPASTCRRCCATPRRASCTR
jgi:hypothetical protein